MATTAHGLEEIVAEQMETIRALRAELAGAKEEIEGLGKYTCKLNAHIREYDELFLSGLAVVSPRLHQAQR